MTAKIESTPDDASLFYQRGELFRLHEEWDAASADYDRAITLDPTLSMVTVSRGQMLLESGSPDAALRALNEVLELQPVAARRVRAHVFMEKDRPAEAAADMLVVLETTPDPDIYLECALALCATGDDAQALSVIEKGTKKLGSVPALEITALDIEIRAHQFENALKRIDRLAAASERKEAWLLRRGEVLEQMELPDEARTSYLAAHSALSKVPAARRETAASVELDTQINAALARLNTTKTNQ